MGGNTLERIETEDDLRLDIFTGFDELGRQTERDFEEQFKAVITFSEEVSEYAENIKVSYIKTQDVLKKYFLK